MYRNDRVSGAAHVITLYILCICRLAAKKNRKRRRLDVAKCKTPSPRKRRQKTVVSKPRARRQPQPQTVTVKQEPDVQPDQCPGYAVETIDVQNKRVTLKLSKLAVGNSAQGKAKLIGFDKRDKNRPAAVRVGYSKAYLRERELECEERVASLPFKKRIVENVNQQFDAPAQFQVPSSHVSKGVQTNSHNNLNREVQTVNDTLNKSIQVDMPRDSKGVQTIKLSNPSNIAHAINQPDIAIQNTFSIALPPIPATNHAWTPMTMEPWVKNYLRRYMEPPTCSVFDFDTRYIDAFRTPNFNVFIANDFTMHLFEMFDQHFTGPMQTFDTKVYLRLTPDFCFPFLNTFTPEMRGFYYGRYTRLSEQCDLFTEHNIGVSLLGAQGHVNDQDRSKDDYMTLFAFVSEDYRLYGRSAKRFNEATLTVADFVTMLARYDDIYFANNKVKKLDRLMVYTMSDKRNSYKLIN